MEERDFSFVPHSDVGAFEIDVVNQHDNLISEGNYNDATALLETESFDRGVRASLLNSMQNKLRKLQLYFLNEFVAEKDEYFSDTEPDITFMKENGYKFWLKPW